MPVSDRNVDLIAPEYDQDGDYNELHRDYDGEQYYDSEQHGDGRHQHRGVPSTT